MLVKNELITKIKDYFNLNVYETKVWLALLGKGSASAGEIATISGVPRSRTYDVLESLEKKGFAIIKIGKPVKYLGVKPKTILEKLKNNVKHDADEKMQMLSKVKTSSEFKQLEELYTVGINPVRREDLSAALRGRSNISSYLREIIEEAQEEVIICTDAEEMYLKQKLFKDTIDSLKRRDIKIKIALFGDSEIIKNLSQSFGVKIKIIDINAKFFIIDRKELLFYTSKDGEKNDQAIWLNSVFFSGAFAQFFDLALKE